jgi:hypothetical protein
MPHSILNQLYNFLSPLIEKIESKLGAAEHRSCRLPKHPFVDLRQELWAINTEDSAEISVWRAFVCKKVFVGVLVADRFLGSEEIKGGDMDHLRMPWNSSCRSNHWHRKGCDFKRQRKQSRRRRSIELRRRRVRMKNRGPGKNSAWASRNWRT